MAQCVTYLARAPKSTESFRALEKALASIRENKGPLPSVPLHLRNASTALMKQQGKSLPCETPFTALHTAVKLNISRHNLSHFPYCYSCVRM